MLDVWKRIVLAICVILLISSVVGIMDGQAKGDQFMRWFDLLPGQINGWSASGNDRIYTRDSIFGYMNGGGEAYLAYDFRQLFVREYARPSAPPIMAEIYQMASSEDAYGIFTNDPDGKSVKVGQGAISAQGLLRFWKGRIFVRIMAQKETDETRAAIMDLGLKIANSIPGSGNTPAILAYLPTEGLLEDRIRYFHTRVTLNVLYYLADSNLLNLSAETEAVLARYQTADRKTRLLLVYYPTPESAGAAYEKFSRVYLSDSPGSAVPMRIEKVENDEYVGARLTDRFLILVFEAGNPETCKRLNEAVEKRIREMRK